MTDDAPPPGEPSKLPENPELSGLPTRVQKAMAALQSLAGTGEVVQAMIPTLAAAWRAGRTGITLAQALRLRLDDDQPLDWPTEIAEEFAATLQDVAATLPSLDEVLEIATDLLELGEEHLEPAQVRHHLSLALQRVEALAGKGLERMIALAFAPAETGDGLQRARALLHLFERLEALFNRALENWLHQQAEARKKR